MRVPSHSWWMAAVLSICTVSVALPGGTEAEDELKSAALLAFVQNAHWTEQLTASAPLTIGVLGRTAFLQCLRANIEGKVVDGHPLKVVEIQPPADPHCCRILYFATDKLKDIKPALQSVASDHILTVGETGHFLEQGGAVNFFLVDGHMAFEVSMGALDHSGIEVSSKLLRFGQLRGLAGGRPGK